MNVNEVKELMQEMRMQGILELEYEKDGVRLRLERPMDGSSVPSAAAVSDVPPVTTVSGDEPEPSWGSGIEIPSPVVGVFYSSSSPSTSPYVQVGDRVEKGQTLCIVEAMKLMNEVSAPCDGIIVEIQPDNGESVQYGEILFRINPIGSEETE